MNFDLRQGDALSLLQQMPAESVNCCVTSPPYYGLRDYGCDGQIGLEATPELFIAKLVAIFLEVRRVLRSDGTCWVNIGDSYAGSWGAQSRCNANGEASSTLQGGSPLSARQIAEAPRRQGGTGSTKNTPGVKAKDLIGIPWMLAFALRANGWYLRQDIIWHKPNPMPESVQDRCTKAHEYVFLLTKSGRYACDMDTIREPATDTGRVNGRDGRREQAAARPPNSRARTLARLDYSELGRNKRSVWTMATQPTPDAHFATFPLELPETCILAGCPEGGLVLDPFSGSGTTGLAAIKNGRRYVGLELNPDYIAITRARLARHYPLFLEPAILSGAA